MEVDDRVRSLYNYYKVPHSQVMRLRGGGGTAFASFFEKAKEMKPDAILMLTDGFVGDKVADPKIPTGWILTSDGKTPYDFGKLVLKLPDLSLA
jgi:predicted metal-dependent peptidase